MINIKDYFKVDNCPRVIQVSFSFLLKKLVYFIYILNVVFNISENITRNNKAWFFRAAQIFANIYGST